MNFILTSVKIILKNSGIILRYLMVLLLSLLCACQTVEKPIMQQKTFKQLPNWQDAKLKHGFFSFVKSCRALKNKDSGKFIVAKDRRFLKNSAWQNTCAKIDPKITYQENQIRQYFEDNFTPYAILQKSGDKGLFTGYHEIILNGSLKKTKRFLYPLYKRPPELKDKVPYYTHSEINSGALKNRKLELLWVDDPIRLYFLQIQGSGIINLQNGQIIRVGYAGQNNRQYYAIGKYLLDNNFISKDKISAQSIMAWLKQNPKRAKEVMEMNPSYVFFKTVKRNGAAGAMNVVLTPFASLAIDRHKIPLGAPLWLDVELSPTPHKPRRKLQNLFIAQDTGGAIKGIIRGDIFFGSGSLAEELAGYQKGLGSYYILLPK